MADNKWDPELAGEPEILNGPDSSAAPGPGPAFEDLSAAAGGPRPDITTPMPDPAAQPTAPLPSVPAPDLGAPNPPRRPLPPPSGDPVASMPGPGNTTEMPAGSTTRFAAPGPSVPAPEQPTAGMPAATAGTVGRDGSPPTTPPSVSSSGWSPMGATPSGPPVRPEPQPGATRYLPPVAPPGDASSSQAASGIPTSPPTVAPAAQPVVEQRGSRWGWRALVSFIGGGLIAAAGFGAAQLAPVDEPQEAAVATVDASVTTTTTTIPAARDSGTVPLAPPDADEPASFVARNLGPAVVQIETQLGVGSGVIYDDGLILTNNHVVERASTVRVKLADGRVLIGEVAGADAKTDVAVVSVGPGEDLPIAQLATGAKASVGQVAIAIGSPFDLQQSVTAGIVSAVDRPIQNLGGSVVAMIQTDAPINPGNSGGALADRQGRVIGINTSIQTDGVTNANVGVGFAIPIDTVIRIADLLVAGEPIEPGFLGVRGEDPEGGQAGVELTEVTPDSAAEGAGLQIGDRVLSLNGAPVTGFAELAGLVLANQAGDTVTLEIIRGDELIEIDVVLGLNDNEN